MEWTEVHKTSAELRSAMIPHRREGVEPVTG
jgi:hypothetical protein